MQDYQALCLQDDKDTKQQENMLNMCSKQHFIPTNYFTHYSVTNTWDR